MSYFPTIRYEYADESNSSQPSISADPPLYREDQCEQSHFFLETSNDPSLSFPPSIMQAVSEDENLSPSQFSPFGTNPGYHQPQQSSTAYYWRQPHGVAAPDEKQLPEMMTQEQQQRHQFDQQHFEQVQRQDGAQRQHLQRHIKEELFDESLRFELRHQSHIAPFEEENHQQMAQSPSAMKTMPKDGLLHQKQRQTQLRRAPLQSKENISADKTHNLNSQSVPDYFNQLEHCDFDEIKTEDDDDMKMTNSTIRTGPPAHWRVEATEKRPQKHHAKRSKKTSLSRHSYETDEHGNQIVIVGGQASDYLDATDDDPSALMDDSGERENGPPVAPNGFVKPAYSYSCLIGLSLKNSDTGELTVSEIYAFLCHHFPYFREAPSGWKNSVRHNLSLNKCFQKIEVETPGSHGRKSCLWRMNPQKCAKMDQELRKWRDRDEPRILNAMETPGDLDSLQNGTMGMPPNMKPRRFSVPVHRENPPIARPSTSSNQHQQQGGTRKSGHPKQSIANAPSNSHFSVNFGDFDRDDPYQQSIVTSSQKQQRQEAQPCESVHAQAARKLENLLQQKQSLESDRVGGRGAGIFGGFTLISGSGINTNTGKKRRSSDSGGSATSSGHSSRRQSRLSNEYSKQLQPPPPQWPHHHQSVPHHQQQHFYQPSDDPSTTTSSSMPLVEGQFEQSQQLQVEGRRRSMAVSVLYEQMSGSSTTRRIQPHHQQELSDHHHQLIPLQQQLAPQELLKPNYGTDLTSSQHRHAHYPCSQSSAQFVGGLDSCERALNGQNALMESLEMVQSPK